MQRQPTMQFGIGPQMPGLLHTSSGVSLVWPGSSKVFFSRCTFLGRLFGLSYLLLHVCLCLGGLLPILVRCGPAFGHEAALLLQTASAETHAGVTASAHCSEYILLCGRVYFSRKAAQTCAGSCTLAHQQ